MDFMGLIHDSVFSKEAVARRREARARRREQLFSKIGTALGKDAGNGWNMPVDAEEVQSGVPIGTQHPGAAALLIVREALAEYTIPTKVDLQFKRIRRASGHGAYAMDEGEVWVGAMLHSMSGPMHYVEIPVMVHQGRLLSPSVLVDQGQPRVITQNTIDDIIGRGEFTATVPPRKNMFAPPPLEAQAPRTVPRVHPGMYHVPPSRGLIASAITGVRRAFYDARTTETMQGPSNVTGAEVPGADGTHIDVGERKVDAFYPSQKVKTNREVLVQARGGTTFRIPVGAQGEVIRDVDGAQRAYYVRFMDLGYSATVAGVALRG